MRVADLARQGTLALVTQGLPTPRASANAKTETKPAKTVSGASASTKSNLLQNSVTTKTTTATVKSMTILSASRPARTARHDLVTMDRLEHRVSVFAKLAWNSVRVVSGQVPAPAL